MLKKILRTINDESGQSMMEYSFMSFMILAGGSLALTPTIDKFFEAYNIYLAGFFYVLSLPII